MAVVGITLLILAALAAAPGMMGTSVRLPRRLAAPSRWNAGPWETALAFALPLFLYLALPSATINGDGMAYWASLHTGQWGFLPGHVLYLPFLSGLFQVCQTVWPGCPLDGLLRLVNQVAGAGSVGLVFAAAGRLGISRFGQWLSAALTALSFGVWIQAVDVETYALALVFVAGSVYFMTRCLQDSRLRWTILLGVCNSLAALFHLATITLGVATVLLLLVIHGKSFSRLLRHLAVYFATTAACFGLPVCWIGFVHLELASFPALLGWLKSSEHHYHVVFDALSIPRALYGFARNFLFLESFWSGPRWLIALKGLALLAGTGWLGWQWRVQPGRMGPRARIVLGCLLGFVLCQVVLGVYFFGSDLERWVFLTPFAALALAAGVENWPASQRWQAALGVALLGLVNLAHGIGPLASDRTVERQVHALAEHLTDQTLVICPGHDWLSYYSYYTPSAKPLDRLSLIGLALRLRDDHPAFYAEIDGRIAQALRDGKQVLMIRVLDPGDSSRETPWPEVEAFGLTPDAIRTWFQRYRWEEIRLNDPLGTRIHRLETRDSQTAAKGDNHEP